MLPTGNCSQHGSVEGGDGPSRAINGEEIKLRGSGRKGVHVKNNKRHSGQGDIYTHKVHINCYLQVQQSFKFPVE